MLPLQRKNALTSRTTSLNIYSLPRPTAIRWFLKFLRIEIWINPEVFRAPDRLPDQNLWMTKVGCSIQHVDVGVSSSAIMPSSFPLFSSSSISSFSSSSSSPTPLGQVSGWHIWRISVWMPTWTNLNYPWNYRQHRAGTECKTPTPWWHRVTQV